MVIHCLTCGKSISSRQLACPYCKAEVTDLTLGANGIEYKEKISEKVKIGFLHALARK
ncbi:hypothetical protein HOF67_04385 [Candidatus Peregrinibacteria bacterium]|nr:hypothetical protein [Candidatus Peregrinibacteria bacterium]